MATITGTAGDDVLLGLSDDDRLIGSDGDDILNGGSGFDIADYSHLGQSMTLTPGGGVIKGGGGIDTLIEIETIVGDPSQLNTINASTAGDGVAMDVNLAMNTANVRNIPGIGNLNFTVENFNDIVGTNGASTLIGNSNNNHITGGSGDDAIVGSGGNDVLQGGGGNNTLDYSNLGHGITILPRGVIDKGNSEQDTVNEFTTIIGANGFANTIDASSETSGASLNVNLANHSLGINNLPGGGSQQFEIKNFVNVVGSIANDTIIGDSNDNIITGSKGSDTLDGGTGNNTLDYSNLGHGITILPRGTINKGGDFGKDKVNNFSTIIGANGQANTIDASSETSGASLNVNLANHSLGINNLPGGGSQQFEIKNFVNVVGSIANDTIIGDSNNNIITGSGGSDTLKGGGGHDTLDYSNLGRAVTILPRGVIDKGNSEQDTVNEFTTIIGANGFANTIDASSETSGASLNVNLANHSLGIDNIPGGGSQQFEIKNFVNVVGSIANDTIIGDSNDNTITGSKGSDTLDGGTGNNTLDYSNLGHAITILPRGAIDKGGDFGKDKVNNFSTIIGANGFANTIDASSETSGASLNVNLANHSLGINNLPGGGSQQFEIKNFVNVVGSKNNDTIVGGNIDSKLIGGGGNDRLHGGNNNDIITGTNSTVRGVGEIDTLSGGGGKDKFILGDKNGAYYAGKGYAQITDFNLFSDSIDVGSLKSYSFGFAGKNTIDLFSGCNPWNRDLVAKIQLTDSSVASLCKGFSYAPVHGFGGFSFSQGSIFGGIDHNLSSITAKISIAHG